MEMEGELRKQTSACQIQTCGIGSGIRNEADGRPENDTRYSDEGASVENIASRPCCHLSSAPLGHPVTKVTVGVYQDVMSLPMQ